MKLWIEIDEGCFERAKSLFVGGVNTVSGINSKNHTTCLPVQFVEKLLASCLAGRKHLPPAV